jgi:hypothetical protein
MSEAKKKAKSGGGGSGSGGGGGSDGGGGGPTQAQLREQMEASRAATLSHLRQAVAQSTEAEEQGQEALECVL